jgi:hypothetical protein
MPTDIMTIKHHMTNIKYSFLFLNNLFLFLLNLVKLLVQHFNHQIAMAIAFHNLSQTLYYYMFHNCISIALHSQYA